MNILIGISGKIGSGKDTVGTIMRCFTTGVKKEFIPDVITSNSNLIVPTKSDKYFDLEIKKFAYKLKVFISMLTGIPVADLEKAEVKNSKLGEEWAYLLWWNGQNMLRVNPNRYKDFEPHRLKNYTVREMLQYLGTELFRYQLHEDVWVNALFADYKTNDSFEEDSKWIITDVRFPNEAKAIEKRGGLLIRVDNPEYNPYEGEHSSETSLDDYNFGIRILNNKQDGLMNLVEVVEHILVTNNIISI